MTAPIEKRVTVPLAPAAAFDLFTSGVDSWWPKDRHSLSAGDGKVARAITIEPKLGGAVTEIRHDGDSALWGSVTAWEPGRRFAMSWHVGSTPSAASRVTVTFEPAEGGARVTLVHDGWEALGAGADETRGHYAKGWDTVFLACYAEACAAA